MLLTVLLLPVFAIALVVAIVLAVFATVLLAPVFDILTHFQPSKFSSYGTPKHYK